MSLTFVSSCRKVAIGFFGCRVVADWCDSFRSPFDVRYGCSSDRCRVSVRSVRFGGSASVVSNKVPVVIFLVENVV